jgi:hypothetical protein
MATRVISERLRIGAEEARLHVVWGIGVSLSRRNFPSKLYILDACLIYSTAERTINLDLARPEARRDSMTMAELDPGASHHVDVATPPSTPPQTRKQSDELR